MPPAHPVRVACAALLALAAGSLATCAAEEKVTFEDQVTPILRSHCLSCHNPDKTKGDLDLTSFSALLKGGGSGKAAVPGDPEGSKLFKSVAQTEEPYMPNNAPKIPDAEIEVLRKWIAGGLLEKSSSKALAGAKPKLDTTFKAAASGKPEGPAVMPVDWLLEPALHTTRSAAVTALAGAPWSPLIAVGSPHQLLLFDSASLELAGVLALPDGNAESVRFSRDGRLLVVGGGHAGRLGFVDLYEVTTGRKLSRLGAEYDSVLTADLNGDQTEAALGGPSKHVKIYSTRDGSLIRDLKKHTDWVTAVSYSPDSILLASGDRNGGLVVWEADSGQELYTLTGHQAAISALDWRDDGQVLLSASEDGTIRLWDMREGQQAAKWNAHRDGVLDARFTHDGRIASCGRDRRICLWDGGGKKLKNWESDSDLPVRVAFNHDGSRVFCAGWSGQVRAWQAADGKAAGEISSNPPTLAERLGVAQKRAEAAQAEVKKAGEAVAAAEAAAGQAKTELAAADRSTPAFGLAAALGPAREAQARVLASARQAVDRAKTAADKAAAELAAAETEAAKAPAGTEIEKLDHNSDVFKEATRRHEAAQAQVTTCRAAVERERKNLADLQASVDKAAAALAAAETETGKTALAVEAADPAYQRHLDLEKRLAAADTRLTEARAVADRAKAGLAFADASVARVKAAQTAVALHSARQALAAQEVENEKLRASLAEAEAAATARGKELADARAELASLAAQTPKLEAGTVTAGQVADTNRATLRLAAEALVRSPEDDPALKALVDRREQFRQSTNQVHTASASLAAARDRAADLSRKLPAITDQVAGATTRLEAAKTALAHSATELATRQQAVATLGAERERWLAATK